MRKLKWPKIWILRASYCTTIFKASYGCRKQRKGKRRGKAKEQKTTLKRKVEGEKASMEKEGEGRLKKHRISANDAKDLSSGSRRSAGILRWVASKIDYARSLERTVGHSFPGTNKKVAEPSTGLLSLWYANVSFAQVYVCIIRGSSQMQYYCCTIVTRVYRCYSASMEAKALVCATGSRERCWGVVPKTVGSARNRAAGG